MKNQLLDAFTFSHFVFLSQIVWNPLPQTNFTYSPSYSSLNSLSLIIIIYTPSKPGQHSPQDCKKCGELQHDTVGSHSWRQTDKESTHFLNSFLFHHHPLGKNLQACIKLQKAFLYTVTATVDCQYNESQSKMLQTDTWKKIWPPNGHDREVFGSPNLISTQVPVLRRLRIERYSMKASNDSHKQDKANSSPAPLNEQKHRFDRPFSYHMVKFSVLVSYT